AAVTHLARRAGKAACHPVLNSDYGSGLHGFEAGFEQKLFEERIAHLHVGPLGLGLFAEFFRRHGSAVNAVASGLRSDVDYGIAFARRLRIKNLITPHEAQRERIDQRIARVARLKLRFTAEIWDAETVSVRRNP